jgi:hypothetical protein
MQPSENTTHIVSRIVKKPHDGDPEASIAYGQTKIVSNHCSVYKKIKYTENKKYIPVEDEYVFELSD